MLIREDTGFFTRLLLHRHVHPAGRIFTDQDNSQARCYTLLFQCHYISGNLFTNFSGNRLTINDLIHVKKPPLPCTIKFIDTGNKMKYDYTQRGVDCKDVWVSKCGKKERKKFIKSRHQLTI